MANDKSKNEGQSAAGWSESHNIADLFEVQAGWCRRMGSPFTEEILRLALADIRAGGILAAVLQNLITSHPEEKLISGLALRFTAALHYAVLKGTAPAALAAFYRPKPHTGEGLWPAIEGFLHREPDFFHQFLRQPPQTNEIMRAGALLGGFLLTAARTDLPLALCEVGASAGLLLNWDKFFYRFRTEEGALGEWGDRQSGVVIEPKWHGAVPDLSVRPQIARRMGCDANPLDPHNEENALRLQAYVWPDQEHRLARLRAGLALARAEGQKIEAMELGAFLAEKLATRRKDEVLVIYHSIVWAYLTRQRREEVSRMIAEAGRQSGAPLAWLSFEQGSVFGRPNEAWMEVCWRFWDKTGAFEERILAQTGGHGEPTHWFGEAGN